MVAPAALVVRGGARALPGGAFLLPANLASPVPVGLVLAGGHCIHARACGLDRQGHDIGRRSGDATRHDDAKQQPDRSEEHTSELQSLMSNSYAVFCLKKKNNRTNTTSEHTHNCAYQFTS